MARIFQTKPIAAIDIGTTKICVIVARVHSDNSIEVLGLSKTPSQGLKKGVVVDIAQTTRSIRMAVTEAELMCGMPIESVVIGISGAHVQSCNATGVIPVKRGVVSDHDLTLALEAAQAVPLPDGMQLLHAIPQFYVIDAQDAVHDPRGMHGIRLEIKAHLIMGATHSVQNLIDCCHAAGVRVDDIILEQLASAQAVLTEDERELGVSMLDIGGGTSDLAVFYQGAIRHTKVFPVAGNQVTNDLAIGLRVGLKEAERIKRDYGYVHHAVELSSEPIYVQLVDQQQTQRIDPEMIVRILEPRIAELCMLVAHEIHSQRIYQGLTCGIVLTGGGALLRGITQLGAEVFGVPVRVGLPSIEQWKVPSLASPIYATCCGLIHYAHHKVITGGYGSEPIVKRVVERMKSWVQQIF